MYASLGLKNADIWLSLGLALQLACNATISFATIYHFRQQKVDAFRHVCYHMIMPCLLMAPLLHRQSTNLIDRLIQMALRSALPPTFMAGIALITTEVYGITDAVPFACAIIVSQTFVISLLYTLNAREGLGRILAGPPRNLSWVATNVEEEQVRIHFYHRMTSMRLITSPCRATILARKGFPKCTAHLLPTPVTIKLGKSEDRNTVHHTRSTETVSHPMRKTLLSSMAKKPHSQTKHLVPPVSRILYWIMILPLAIPLQVWFGMRGTGTPYFR